MFHNILYMKKLALRKMDVALVNVEAHLSIVAAAKIP